MNIAEKLTDTLTYGAGLDKQVDLPTDGVITRIDLECSVTLDGSAASNLSVLGLWRIMQNLKVEGGGGKVYFGMSGTQMGMLLHYLNLVDFPGTTWREIVATTQAIRWRLHFGSQPRDVYGRDNPFDLSCAIPAQSETNLKLTWGCSASDDVVDATRTISSATMYVTTYRVLGVPSVGLMVPISSSESCDPSATKSDLSYQRDIPSGSYVRRIAILAIDATAGSSAGPLLKDDQMTEVGIYLVPENSWLMKVRAKTIELSNPLLDGMQVVNTPNTQSPFNSTGGLYLIDLRQFGQSRLYGLDATNRGSKDTKLAMTIGAYSSAETEHVFYDMVRPFGK